MSQVGMNIAIAFFLVIVGSYLLISGRGNVKLKGTKYRVQSSTLIRVVGAVVALAGIIFIIDLLN